MLPDPDYQRARQPGRNALASLTMPAPAMQPAAVAPAMVGAGYSGPMHGFMRPRYSGFAPSPGLPAYHWQTPPRPAFAGYGYGPGQGNALAQLSRRRMVPVQG